MIKRVLESGYNRAFGAARDILARFGKPFSNRTSWIQLLYVIVIVAFMAGFVSAVFFPVADQALIVYPAQGAQTIAETIIDAVIILFGTAGIYIAYLSGRQTTKPRMVNLYLAIALLLIVVSVFMGIQLSLLKSG
jgi:amino acid transporter